MYVRETIPVDCGGLPGYHFVPNRDQRWNDITRRHLYSNIELADACNANPTCEGFNTNFYLKHEIQEPRFWKSTTGLCEGLFIRTEVQFPTVFCEDRISINTRFTRTKTCSGPFYGQARFFFETHDTAGQGFDDDEYVIRVFQGGTEVWASTERGRAGTGSSRDELLGTASGGIWQVQFDCTLDSIWNKCENGDFEFRLVDCGCGGGAAPLLECDIQTVNRARNALCPATPAPTPEPTPVPTTLAPSEPPETSTPTIRPTRALAEEGQFGCFSGEVLVDVKDVGSKPMKELEVGDKVLTRNDIYEPVYSFGHIRRDQWLMYIRIHAEGLHAPLELSKDHLVYVTTHGKEHSTPVRAASVQVGNRLVIIDPAAKTTTNTSHTISSRASHVDTVMRKGLFAPFTKAGVISVNGALASQYVTGQPAVNNLHIGDFDTGITWHWLVHAFQAGPRLYHRFFGINHGAREDETSDGSTVLFESEFPGVYMQSFRQMRWILVNQNPFAQYILLPMFMTATMAVSSTLCAVELVLDNLLVGHSLEAMPERLSAEHDVEGAVWASTTTSCEDTN